METHSRTATKHFTPKLAIIPTLCSYLDKPFVDPSIKYFLATFICVCTYPMICKYLLIYGTTLYSFLMPPFYLQDLEKFPNYENYQTKKTN